MEHSFASAYRIVADVLASAVIGVLLGFPIAAVVVVSLAFLMGFIGARRNAFGILVGFLAVAIWVVSAVVIGRRHFQNVRRIARWQLAELMGLCRWCGYDLTGNVSGVCPECGESIADDEEPLK